MPSGTPVHCWKQSKTTHNYMTSSYSQCFLLLALNKIFLCCKCTIALTFWVSEDSSIICIQRVQRWWGWGENGNFTFFFWLFLLLQKYCLSQDDQPSLFVWNCSDFNNESLTPWVVPQSQANLKVQHPRFFSSVTLHPPYKHNSFFHGTTQSIWLIFLLLEWNYGNFESLPIWWSTLLSRFIRQNSLQVFPLSFLKIDKHFMISLTPCILKCWCFPLALYFTP